MTSTRLVRTVDTAREVKRVVQETMDKFADACLKAKESEKEIESRLPAVPAAFRQ